MTSLPPELGLTPVSRNPLRLSAETVSALARFSWGNSGDRCTQDGGDRQAAPQTSIIIVTFNGLIFTKMCLQSILENSGAQLREIIVVDNCSDDGTREYLQGLERRIPVVRVIYNSSNRGFAPANNQGLSAARGDFLVLLNNDTIVPPGWLERLMKYSQDPTVGLIGPVTNRIGNEAEIDVSYETYGEMERFAVRYTDEHRDESWDIPTLCMYCLGMRRDVWERLGPLDERYEVGLMEDDDYSMRAREAGLRVVCAEDVFVHHFGSASFGHLAPSGEYSRLFEANRRRFEEKWGRPWQSHERRRSRTYLSVLDRIRTIVRKSVPSGRTVLVVSKGDDLLLDLGNHRAWHFPQDENGDFAGCYPADSAAAIEHVESLQRKGAEYLLIPSSSAWWLDHYTEFHQHLVRKGRQVWSDDNCTIFRL